MTEEEEIVDPKLSTNVSPQQTKISPGTIEMEVDVTLDTLSTLLKAKRKILTPMYFNTRKSARVKQGRPQTPTKSPTTIKQSPNKKDERGSDEGNIQEVTSPKKTPMTYTTRNF